MRVLPSSRSLFLVACFGVFALAGCQSTLERAVYPNLTPEETFERLVVSSAYGMAPDEEILVIPPELREVIDEIARHRGRQDRLNALGNLFVQDDGLELEYDPLGTYSAAETFYRRSGNCLSFTHLFIAMARELGIDARYREVFDSMRWDEVGEFTLLNRHVVVYGELSRYDSYEADFGQLDRSQGDFLGKLMDDDRARALHFNNLGAQALTENQEEQATRYLARALLIDPEVSYIWSNLGTAYRRLGKPELAEPAYRQALRVHARDATAIAQLARLYETIGEDALASAYRAARDRLRAQNPYREYHRGMEAMNNGDLADATRALQRAVRLQPDTFHFHLEFGKALALQGQYRRARRQFEQAVDLAERLEDERAILETLQMLEEHVAEQQRTTREPPGDSFAVEDRTELLLTQ